MDGVFSRRNINWVNKRNLILLKKQQSDSDYNWLESWVIDTDGNIIIKIAPGANSLVHFSENGHYFLYTILGFESPGGSIWIDYLPQTNYLRQNALWFNHKILNTSAYFSISCNSLHYNLPIAGLIAIEKRNLSNTG